MSSIILVGVPNSGKSLLFNRLTGLSQKVANFPHVTVDIRSGHLKGIDAELIDFPGAYSLQPISIEEEIAVEHFSRLLLDDTVTQVFCLFDVTRMEKGLYFTLQVIRECRRHKKPVIVLANMVDLLQQHHLSCDFQALYEAIKAPIIPISAKKGTGIDELLAMAKDNIEKEGVATEVDDTETPDAFLRGLAHKLAHQYGPKGDILIRSQNRLDNLFLHSIFGGLLFFAIMYFLFQSIFTWATPLMDAVESGIANLAILVLPLFENKMVKDFIADAIFGGIGAFLVFVPQIFILTLIIGLLEDSGYLARAAVICHKPLRYFGLTGKSFVPLLSGVACAIPAIYAARSIESRSKRILTYIAIPLMPCSARLPVYTLLIAAFIPNTTAFGGLMGWQGLALFSLYFLGIILGLLVTAVLSKINKTDYADTPFVLEMPAYRLPLWKPLVSNAYNRSKHFVTNAGQIIFLVTLVIWTLSYFPNYGQDIQASWLGTIGQWIEPLFEPIGLDWRYGVAIMTSFLAREVFVGTLGTIFGVEGDENQIVPLVDYIQNSDLALGSGVALLVLFAIALQCVSTLAVLSKESNSSRLAIKMFIGYGLFAYLSAILAYHLVEALV